MRRETDDADDLECATSDTPCDIMSIDTECKRRPLTNTALMNPDRIYLDHSATTPVRPEVFDAMLPFLHERFGNPGSIHAFGREARRAVDDARDKVAALIHADPREIVFTAGGTEADNMAILGCVETSAKQRKRIIISSIEHHAVLNAARVARRRFGVEVCTARVNEEGLVDTDYAVSLINDDTILVSVMHANNEIGAIQPIDAIAKTCVERGVTFHTDAVQSVGKVPVDVKQMSIDLLAISGHKMYAPKGVGACFVRRRVELAAQIVGGGQERQRRAGTENVAAIVGLGVACEIALKEMALQTERLTRLRDMLERGLSEKITGVTMNGARAHRLPSVLNIRFDGADGESVILGLDMEGIAVSSGSACTSGSIEPSHVLLAMGLGHQTALGAIRFSLGLSTTEAMIDRAIRSVASVVERIRQTSFSSAR